MTPILWLMFSFLLSLNVFSCVCRAIKILRTFHSKKLRWGKIMQEGFQENNLDIGGRLTWQMAPMFEIITHPMPPFVIIESGIFNARPKFFSRREGRDGFLILYTQSGKGLLKYKDGEYELLPGSTVLIDCRLRHEYRTYDDIDGNWFFYWIHFACEYMNFYTQVIYGDSYTLLRLGGDPIHIIETVLKNLQYVSPEKLLLLSDCVYKLLMLMTEAARVEKSNREKPTATKEMLKKAVEYIKENYWMPLDLDDLAKRFKISKYHFIKVFKEYTGMTPYTFLITERVNVAKILLHTTDLSIAAICRTVGFKSETNFINKFKAIYKETPQAYRQSMQ